MSKDSITDWITHSMNRLQLETSHKSCCDDELASASVKKEDFENQMATYSFKLETAVCEVAELRADLGDLSQHLMMNAMRVDGLEGVVNSMMTNVCQAAGGGGDVSGGRPGGDINDASGACGDGHGAALVRGFTRSPVVQERSRSSARAKRSQALGSCTEASNNTKSRQSREKKTREWWQDTERKRRNEEGKEEEKRTAEGVKNRV